MKQNSQIITANAHSAERGFTIVELLVVLAIMGVFLSAVLVNYAGTRGIRNLRIAQNELATNIRKIQSYALSSRDTTAGAVRYYVLKFDTAAPSAYVAQAVQQNMDVFTSPVETFRLPNGIFVQQIQVQQPYGASTTTPGCVQMAFALPFNKLYLDTTCGISGSVSSLIRDQGALENLDNSLVTIVLRDSQSNTTRSVVVNGASGVVTIP